MAQFSGALAKAEILDMPFKIYHLITTKNQQSNCGLIQRQEDIGSFD